MRIDQKVATVIAVSGIVSFFSCFLTALTIFGVRMAGSIPLGAPPSFLWMWMIASAWLVFPASLYLLATVMLGDRS